MTVSKKKCGRYTIERITSLEQFTGELCLWLREGGKKAATHVYGSPLKMEDFNWIDFARHSYLSVCFKDGRPVGAMLASMFVSDFDPETRILMQDSLYVTEPGCRAAHFLLHEFIDFGKSNAKHIITVIGPHTNIKGRSLEKLGFKKTDVHYRLEVQG